MKIVIVGGGTAGWIAASTFIKYTKGHDITVIESSKIPIIGAGEGATGIFPWFITQGWEKPIDQMDFLRKTKGTIKLAINLKNWKGDGKSYYSPIHASSTHNHPIDTQFFGSILKYGRADYSSLHSWILNDNLVSIDKRYRAINPTMASYSYHFDGNEVGKYFKELCVKNGVKIIDSEVSDLTFDETEYLTSVSLKDGTILSADLWFDCTGFNKTLVGKTKNKWISFSKWLPTNNAITFSTDISSRKVRFETESETMNAGWKWKIPLQQRHGNGYVYCDGFQSYEQSLDELNKMYGGIEPIRNIKFESGRYENIWHNNIVSIGLSSHFLEPLQATSIHITILSMANLVLHYLRNEDSIKNNSNRKRYNDSMAQLIDDYKHFIQMHYLSGRCDTPFWKFIQNELEITDVNKEYIEISKNRSLNLFDFDSMHGCAGWGVWGHILDMVGLFDKDIIKKELHLVKQIIQAEQDTAKIETNYKKIKDGLLTAEEFFKYLKL